jgi:hypothetical protein
LVLVTRQETIVLPKAKPIVGDNLPVVVRIRYNEPNFINRMEALLEEFQRIGVEEFIV